MVKCNQIRFKRSVHIIHAPRKRHARVNRCEASADEAILILSYCLPYGSLLKQCQYKSKERFPFFEDSSHK